MLIPKIFALQLQMDTFPCGNFIQLLPYDETQMSWIYVTVTYIQPMDYYGYDDVKVYVRDDMNATSEITTIRFAVMESPCQNKGQCQGLSLLYNSFYSCFFFSSSQIMTLLHLILL